MDDNYELMDQLEHAKVTHLNLRRKFYAFCKHIHALTTHRDFIEGCTTDLGPNLAMDDGAQEISDDLIRSDFKMSYLHREYVFRFCTCAASGDLIGRIECMSLDIYTQAEKLVDKLIFSPGGEIIEGPTGTSTRSVLAFNYVRNWLLRCLHKDILG